MTSVVIDEFGLDSFRQQHLSPEAILDQVVKNVVALYNLSVGVGKSIAADSLLTCPLLYDRFDLVIYTAPTRAIINERAIVAGQTEAPVRWTVFHPRPKDRCGPYAAVWAKLEVNGCSAYGKAALCSNCDATDETGAPCGWPSQSERARDCKLLFLTEQNLILNRSLIPFLKWRTGAGRVLVILDEARMLDANFELSLRQRDLERFRSALEQTRSDRFELIDTWAETVDTLLSSPRPGEFCLKVPPYIHSEASNIQAAGLRLFGRDFRYVGYDLAQFGLSRPSERWLGVTGDIRYVARPYLGCHALILSAHLTAEYVGHRLGRDRVHSPFEHTSFQHSGTRIVNLSSRTGADRNFRRNLKQVLDTFAVLLLRNIEEDRTTLLVSRKKSKVLCADYIQKRLAGWGVDIQIVTGDFEGLPSTPDPRIVPLINYGVLGVNDFEEYESCFCLNSYYVSSSALADHLQECEPEHTRRKLEIRSGFGCPRRVCVAEGSDPDGGYALLGNTYLHKLEVDPVIQAAGRVRFLTRARDVVFFQMNDLTADVGPHETVHTLAALRATFAIPSATKIDHGQDASRIQGLCKTGLTVAEAATRLGMSRRTAFRRLKGVESARFPTNSTYRKSGTLPASVDDRGGAA